MGGEEQVLEATEEACRVYVGNLLPKAKERHLTSKFARFGTIHSVWIARKPPGFAFVRFAARDAAQRAVEACGEDGVMEILGKAVRVQMAEDKDSKHQEQAGDRHAVKDEDADAVRTVSSCMERKDCSSRRRGRSEESRGRRRDTRSRSGERRRLGEREHRPSVRRDRRSRSRSRGEYRHSRRRSRSRSRSEMRATSSNRSRSKRRHVGRSDSRSRSRGSSRDRESARRRRRRSSRSSSRGRR